MIIIIITRKIVTHTSKDNLSKLISNGSYTRVNRCDGVEVHYYNIGSVTLLQTLHIVTVTSNNI
jgi:hypothetical protein